MASAAASALGSRVRGGLVIAPGPVPIRSPIASVDFTTGGHPVPTPESERAGRRALALAESTAPRDDLVVLLSGGASALMAVPVPPITLEDKRLTTERLLLNGADIHALNTVRKHLSAIKGGQLAAASPAPCTTLVISDVVGDDLSVIGSGPTVADASTFGDAYDVIHRFGGVAGCPDRVIRHLKRGLEGDLAETPKPGDPRLAGRHRTVVIGGRATAMRGAANEAQRRGLHVVVLDEPVVGEARMAAAVHVQQVRRLLREDVRRPLCLISSGETTVHVKGDGRGGRNQEFALATSRSMAGARGSWAAASVGTDGIDGPTDAAGAIVDAESLARAERAGLAPVEFLDHNNSYQFFAELGDLIQIGPTGTNVGDLQVFLVA